MAEAVKVIVRCRPMNEREKNLKCLESVNIDNKIAQCSLKNPNEKKGPPKNFTFDGAYGTDSTTEQIYADIGYPLVEGVTEGYNGTIFAYGQTGCGKSFSMQGIPDPPTQRGIIPRAFDHIFETITVSAGAKYLVLASYLEIYNEEIRDLLGKDVKAKLDLKEHPDRGVYVQGLSMIPCKNVRECHHIMERGWKNRSTGSTLMNADSSRSHSIFSIHLERCEEDEDGEEHIRAAKLNLVDLAGSERQAKTGSTGDRLKEATKINLSLSALGNVISALVDGKSKHIPYRDSKLTRLLQDSLGGNTKTLMVACLSPADNNYDETLSTLRYANRAKNIKNKPKINEDPKDALLREYHDEITKLKAMLRGEIPIELEGGTGGAHVPKAKVQTKIVEKIVHIGGEELEEEKERIRQGYEQKMTDMQNEFDQMRMNKEQVESEMAKLRDQYDQDMAVIDTSVRSPGERESEDAQNDSTKKRKVLSAARTIKLGKSPRGKKKKIETLNIIDENGEDSREVESPSSADSASVHSMEETGDREKMLLMVGQQHELEDKMQDQLEEMERLKSENERRPNDKAGAELMSVTSSDDIREPQREDSDLGYYADPTDDDYLVQPDAQQAIHLNTVRKRGEEGTAAPCSSPTGEHRQDGSLAHEDALRRLEQLQQAMVGGEQANNEEVKERRRKKKKYAEERTEKLREALAQKDGEDIMLDIFDSTQIDLVKQRKALEKQKQKNEALQQEILDLQSEFEFDRIDYLDTIRKQEKTMSWMQSVIDRIHPCLRRDCNYMNMDKIKMQSEWDEDGQCWNLPKMTIEKSKLPTAPPGIAPVPSQRQNGDVQPNIYDELRSEDRYLEKLNRNTEQSSITKDYFKPKRVERLLKNGQDDRYRGNSTNNGNATSPNSYPVTTNGYHRSGSATKQPVGAWQNESTSDGRELRAAAVHGQITNDDALVRKPMRLESLHSLPPKSGKKKKKQYSMDPMYD